MYGSRNTVKAKRHIENTDSDSEIDGILQDISDLIDFYLLDLEDTPVTDATKLKLLNYATNYIAHGEYEMRHGKRDTETGAWSIYNHGWSLFDKYLHKIHGVDLKDQASAKIAATSPSWRYGTTGNRLLKLGRMFWS